MEEDLTQNVLKNTFFMLLLLLHAVENWLALYWLFFFVGYFLGYNSITLIGLVNGRSVNNDLFWRTGDLTRGRRDRTWQRGTRCRLRSVLTGERGRNNGLGGRHCRRRSHSGRRGR